MVTDRAQRLDRNRVRWTKTLVALRIPRLQTKKSLKSARRCNLSGGSIHVKWGRCRSMRKLPIPPRLLSQTSNWRRRDCQISLDDNNGHPRGFKKVERSPWPMNSEFASPTAAQFSVEIEFRQSDPGKKVRQHRATAQLTSHRCIEIGAAWNE